MLDGGLMFVAILVEGVKDILEDSGGKAKDWNHPEVGAEVVLHAEHFLYTLAPTV